LKEIFELFTPLFRRQRGRFVKPAVVGVLTNDIVSIKPTVRLTPATSLSIKGGQKVFSNYAFSLLFFAHFAV
jgi:hypothetical protein